MHIPMSFFGKLVGLAVFLSLTACNGATDSSVTVTGDVSIAYVKRPVAALGNPTDSVVMQGSGGDLYIREKASPNAPETNITSDYTGGNGDVSDPEVSYDGNKIIFAMRRANERWGIFEYDTRTKLAPRRITCDAAVAGDDVDPAYLPNGRIVFSSNRQEASWRQMQAQNLTPYKYTDEYEREDVTVLHTMDADGKNCKQISFNQSHDRNPTVLNDGRIMYSRWDHVGGRNQFSIFTINPDGTNPFILYGAHDLEDIYLNPREMSDGRLVSTYMPLSRTREGGSLEIIDYKNYSANNMAGSGTPPANQLGETNGQFQATRLFFANPPADQEKMRGGGVSPLGRYATPYPLWDGSNRMLVVYTPSQPMPSTDLIGRPTMIEGEPTYGIFMFDLNKRTNQPVINYAPGYFFSDPVALQARPVPRVIGDAVADTTLAGMGLLNVNTVYDTDRLERMGNAVLASGESIPAVGMNARPDIAGLKTPGTSTYANRVARFFRITKAVPTPAGMSRQALGETEFEMQQIVGYGVIEPDGSIRTKVPANTPINITALDKEGRAFTPHTNWLQAREGERRFCKGCHSSRLGSTAGDTTTNEQGALLNTPVSYPHPATTLGTTMADTRTREIDSTALDPKPNLVSADIWTAQYNGSRNPPPYGPPLSTISIDYSGLATTRPTIKGAPACTARWTVNATTGVTEMTGTWSAKDCAFAINYPDHIQPLWNRTCIGCHSGTTPSGGLDLGNTGAGEFGRAQSYQRLLLGEPRLDSGNLPMIVVENDEIVVLREPAAVEPGSARASRLVARLYEQPLKAGSVLTQVAGIATAAVSRAVCDPGPINSKATAGVANPPTACQDHRGMLNPSELRLVNEWVDLGALYNNDPYDASGTLRSNAARLNQGKFERCIMPLFGAVTQSGTCSSCHQAVNNSGFAANRNNRFVLTGNAAGDFNVTASFVTDIATPANSLLLTRPNSAPHPNYQIVMPPPTYDTIREWISDTLQCP